MNKYILTPKNHSLDDNISIVFMARIYLYYTPLSWALSVKRLCYDYASTVEESHFQSFVTGPIKFPCPDHKTEELKFILSDYIVMRMRQYTLVIIKIKRKIMLKRKKTFKTIMPVSGYSLIVRDLR
ncbi:THAP-type domain-containing protein, partial [Aphis craccivora]